MRSEFDEVFKDAYDYWIDDVDIHRYESATGLADRIWHHQQAKVDELQKRVDAVQRLLEVWKEEEQEGYMASSCVDKLEQALTPQKGGTSQ